MSMHTEEIKIEGSEFDISFDFIDGEYTLNEAHFWFRSSQYEIDCIFLSENRDSIIEELDKLRGFN